MGSRHALTHEVITDPPVLNIQSAHDGIEISWDVYYSEYALQIAETPDGPYSALEQMPAIKNFQLSHMLEPPSENARFFRLQKID